MPANKSIPVESTTVQVPSVPAGTASGKQQMNHRVTYQEVQHNPQLGFLGHWATGTAEAWWAITHPVSAIAKYSGTASFFLVGLAILSFLIAVVFGGKTNTGNPLVDVPGGAGSAVNGAVQDPFKRVQEQRNGNFPNGIQQAE